MPPNDSPETRIALVEQRQLENERWRDRTERTLESIAETLKGVLRIEAQNDNLAKEVAALRLEVAELKKDHAARIDAVELEMPLLRQARGGIAEAVKYLLLAVGAGLLALVGLKQ